MFERLSPPAVVAAALIAPPGADMIAALEKVDPLALDPGARVDLMVAWERQSCWVIARGQPVMAAVGHAARLAAEPWNDEAEVTELGMRSAHAEIGAALRLDDHEAATRLDIAATRPLPPDKARQVADAYYPARVIKPSDSSAAACAARSSPPTPTARPTGSAKPTPTAACNGGPATTAWPNSGCMPPRPKSCPCSTPPTPSPANSKPPARPAAPTAGSPSTHSAPTPSSTSPPATAHSPPPSPAPSPPTAAGAA